MKQLLCALALLVIATAGLPSQAYAQDEAGVQQEPPPPPPVAVGCPAGCVERPAGCDIKGNVNDKGERIYHLPGGQFYDKTNIDPSRGDRWFCSPAEAEANGFRRSKR